MGFWGFGVWGLGFGVWGLGFEVWGLGFGVWGWGFGEWGLGLCVCGSRFAVWVMVETAATDLPIDATKVLPAQLVDEYTKKM